jgi:hypothetical protein
MPKNHAHEIENDPRATDYDTRAFADSDALAQLDKMALVVLKNGSAVPVEDQFADYDFPIENRERDRRVLNWAYSVRSANELKAALDRKPAVDYSDADKVAYAKSFLRDFAFPVGGDKVSALDVCIDRVRWDAMVASGARHGAYVDNCKPNDVKDRAEDCAAIREAITGANPGLMCSHTGQTYLSMVLAKAEELEHIPHKVRTRTSKGAPSKRVPL